MFAKMSRYLFVFALSCVCLGRSTAQSSAPQARFAVEFLGFNGFFPAYITIPEAASPNSCTTFIYYHDLNRLADTDASIEQPAGLRFKICVNADTVLITPIVFYGAFDRQNQPASLENVRHQILATHSGKLNDNVTFPEMEQVGLEPLSVRIVTAQPAVPYRPSTRSDAPSVQIEYAPVDRTFGMVTLHNLSNKAVDAFRIGSFQVEDSEEGGSALEQVRRGSSALIAPGASYQVHIGIPQSGKTVNGIFVENPKPQYMVLQAVLFADGSYEGDAQFAANMAAREVGAHVQLIRIDRLVQPILAEEGLDDEAKIDRARSAIRQLSTQADPETIAQFHAQFPGFSDDVLAKAESNLSIAMKDEIGSTDSLIQENEPIFLRHQSRLTLAQWWTSLAEAH